MDGSVCVWVDCEMREGPLRVVCATLDVVSHVVMKYSLYLIVHPFSHLSHEKVSQ